MSAPLRFSFVLLAWASLGCAQIAGLEDAELASGSSGGGATANDKYGKAVLADGPVAYYRLDEAVGSPGVADSSGNGNDGTLSGKVVLGAPGAIAGNGAASFDGVSSINLGDKFGFAGQVEMSVEAWIWPLADDGGFLGKGYYQQGAGYDGWFLAEGSDDLQCVRGGAGVILPKLGKTEYTHVVMTFDGLNLTTYLNGKTAKSTPTTTAVIDHANPVQLGTVNEWASMVGSLDEVAFYDKALSPERVAAHYAAK
ncbi:MAG: LamG domain-containing protein [Myxococcales bacterium]|nr:LamG domain-containing protein [Myxococcales bacterium]